MRTAAAALGGGVAGVTAAARAALLAAMGGFIDGCPCASGGRLARDTALFVPFFDVTGLAFLFTGITGFVTTWHDCVLHEVLVRGCTYTPLYEDRGKQEANGPESPTIEQ